MFTSIINLEKYGLVYFDRSLKEASRSLIHRDGVDNLFHLRGHISYARDIAHCWWAAIRPIVQKSNVLPTIQIDHLAKPSP
jgi:hypothetical protein